MSTSTYRADAVMAADPADVMALLTSPEAIGRWAPVPFEVSGIDGTLSTGDRARVSGVLAGRRVTFEVDVCAVAPGRLSLVASGPVSMEVEYRVDAVDSGSSVSACVALRRGKGLLGGLLAGATGALLSGGALRVALDRMGSQLVPA